MWWNSVRAKASGIRMIWEIWEFTVHLKSATYEMSLQPNHHLNAYAHLREFLTQKKSRSPLKNGGWRTSFSFLGNIYIYKCTMCLYTRQIGTKGNGVGYPHSGTPSQSIPNILQPLYPKSWNETEQGLSHRRTPPSMHNDMIEPHHFPINMFEVHGCLWGRESDYNTSLYQHKPPISKQKSLAQSFQNVPDKQFTAESAIRSPNVFSL